MKTIITILIILTAIVLIVNWSNKRDEKLIKAYEGVEPCAIRNDLPACEN